MRCYRTKKVGLASVLEVQSLFFLLKKIGYAPWPNIILSQTLTHLFPILPFQVVERECIGNKLFNILLTGIFLLTLESDSEEWSYRLMAPLTLWAKWSNRTYGQFECDMTWFCFDFVCSYAWCGCCCIVCWRVGTIFMDFICVSSLKHATRKSVNHFNPALHFI